MRLSSNAKSALEILQEKHLAYTIAKTTIESELKQLLAQRLSAIRHERDMAVRLACDAGVPKTQVGKAIGTSNYKTVQDILANTESVLSVASATISGKVSVVLDSDGVYRVTLNGVGEQNITASATYTFDGEDLVYVAGDLAVYPQLHRNNLIEIVMEQVRSLA